jgi:hypothetical protein
MTAMRTKTITGKFRPAVWIGVLTAALATSALAHHGWTGYDTDKPLTFTGTIRDSGYDNPHGFVKLEVPGNPAKTWHVVLAPPSRMQARGLPKEMPKTGATATVVGYAERTKPDELRAERITIEGQTTELR